MEAERDADEAGEQEVDVVGAIHVADLFAGSIRSRECLVI